jgi:hypothetical protein
MQNEEGCLARAHGGHVRANRIKPQGSRKKLGWDQKGPESSPLPLTPWVTSDQSLTLSHGTHGGLGLHTGARLTGWLVLGKLTQVLRVPVVPPKTDSMPRSAGPAPRSRVCPDWPEPGSRPWDLTSVQNLSPSLAQRDLPITAQQGPERQWQ